MDPSANMASRRKSLRSSGVSSFQEVWEICDLPVGDWASDRRITSFQVQEFVRNHHVRRVYAACTAADESFSTNWPSWKWWPPSKSFS